MTEIFLNNLIFLNIPNTYIPNDNIYYIMCSCQSVHAGIPAENTVIVTLHPNNIVLCIHDRLAGILSCKVSRVNLAQNLCIS